MKTIVLLLAFITLAGCKPWLEVHTDYDPDHDQWTYTTFNWGIPDSTVIRNPLYYSELNDKRIKAAVQKQLLKRGYQITNDNPQLLLQYHIVVEDKTAIATEPLGYAYGPYWTRTDRQAYTYTEGTLILDLTDTHIRQLVWRGWAASAVDGVDSPAQIERLIDLAVRKMFDEFPKRKYKNMKP